MKLSFIKSAIAANARKEIIGIVKKIAPKFYLRILVNRLKSDKGEFEVELLPILCDQKKMSLDIGSALGLYALHMIDNSSAVVAFEPRPKQASNLQSMLAMVTDKTQVETVGLSDRNGEATLRMLSEDLGRSTIEDENTLEDNAGSNTTEIKIKTRKLDEYHFHNIGLIKIDVEGHEMAVLQGAEKTIANNLPNFLIEIEERHKKNAISDTSNFLRAYGYQGFFVIDNELKKLEEFNMERHQNKENVGNWDNNYERKGIYVNNFIFVPKKRISEFIPAFGRLTQ